MFWCKLFFLVSGLRLEFWNLRYTENDQKFYLWLWPRKYQFSVYMDTCETSDQSSCKNVYHNEWAVWFWGKTICTHHIDEFAIFAHKTGILMKCNTLIWSFIKYKHSNVYDFVCKVNVWDTNLAQATSPISDSRTDVPEKTFLSYKCTQTRKHSLLILKTYKLPNNQLQNGMIWLCRVVFNIKLSLLWRHNGRDGISDQPHDCLVNRLLKRRSKKTSKLRFTGLRAVNSRKKGQ